MEKECRRQEVVLDAFGGGHYAGIIEGSNGVNEITFLNHCQDLRGNMHYQIMCAVFLAFLVWQVHIQWGPLQP